jgi:hypothetical protein
MIGELWIHEEVYSYPTSCQPPGVLLLLERYRREIMRWRRWLVPPRRGSAQRLAHPRAQVAGGFSDDPHRFTGLSLQVVCQLVQMI